MMKSYIGIKLIKASPMTENEFRADKNLPLTATDEEGYVVEYFDGYRSWSPKEAFENAYLALTVENSITALECANITAELKAQQIDPKTTLLNCTLRTGFQLYNTSSCVDPVNYSDQLGSENAMRGINEKIWFALGFILQWAKYGLNHTPVITKTTQGE